MEYVAGGSLKDILKVRGSLQELYIAIVMRELLLALQFLHSQGQIHRDIKAANVLLSREGEVKLADFGVSAQITASVSKRHSFVGTPYWMAPEVITQADYDQKADIWSIGITAVELAKGEPPHSQYAPMKALFLIQSSPPPMLESTFSPSFQDFVRLCLARDPAERPDADALLRHKFITTAKKTSFLTDLLDSTSALNHIRSVSSTAAFNTILPAETDTVHRHSRSSGETGHSGGGLKAAAIHRKINSLVASSRSGSSRSSRSNSTSNSAKTFVGLPETEEEPGTPSAEAARMDTDGTVRRTGSKPSFDNFRSDQSFLTRKNSNRVLETVVGTVEIAPETQEALDELVLAVAQLELKDKSLAPRVFGETLRLCAERTG